MKCNAHICYSFSLVTGRKRCTMKSRTFFYPFLIHCLIILMKKKSRVDCFLRSTFKSSIAFHFAIPFKIENLHSTAFISLDLFSEKQSVRFCFFKNWMVTRECNSQLHCISHLSEHCSSATLKCNHCPITAVLRGVIVIREVRRAWKHNLPGGFAVHKKVTHLKISYWFFILHNKSANMCNNYTGMILGESDIAC